MSYFVHCHGHTQASLKDAMTRPKELMERVKSIDQVAVACTDHGNSYAIAELLKVSEKYGIKLIAGNEFYVANLGLDDRSARDSYHLTVLCDGSAEGWKNLCNLHHMSFAKGFYFNPRIDLDVLAEHSEGLIALSGCMGGAALKAYLNNNETEAHRRIRVLKDIFGPERFFIELQNHGLENDEIALPWLRKTAKKYNLKTVATNDFHYCNRDDWQIHDVLVAMGKNQCVYDPNRQVAYEPEQFYVKDYDEMAEMGFSKAELEQSHKIAEMCEPLQLKTKTFHIPALYLDRKGKSLSDAALSEKVKQGIQERYPDLEPEVIQRMKYELEAITKAGFSDYLLIVADVYDFMRTENIPFGPGRGSVGGSIVAYALGITEIDPLKYNLLFERFINPMRVSLPDVDMDISAIHRDRVINYVRNKYGEDKTAQIVTFQSIGGRAAIRDVGRAFRLPLEKADELAKAIPQEGSLTKDRESRAYLEAALESQKVLKNAYESDSLVKQVVDTGIRLEGVTQAVSKHAAGVVISDVPLRDLVPMGIKPVGGDVDPNVVGWEMHFIEDYGLIKYDFLGLRNVDVRDEAIGLMIQHKAVPKSFNANDIPLDDVNTFDMLCKGLTAGLFQLEGTGMTGWLRKMQPDRIEDIMAMVALFRPGPMEHIPSYINRKHGKEKVVYPHKSLEEILKPTFGVPVYQEQLMQIGQKIAGWSLARADQLRKVIGKKIVDDIAKEKKEFVAGAVEQGHKANWAEKLFTEFIEPAARYSFNCLSGDTVVVRSSGGRFSPSPEITLADLYEAQESNTPTGRKLRGKRDLRVLQMYDDGLVRPGKLKKVHKTGEQWVYLIKTKSGKSVKATLKHRFLTTSGYKTVAELLPNPTEHCLISVGGNASNYAAKAFHSTTRAKKTVSHFNDATGNGQWIDGRAVKFRDSSESVRERSRNRCENSECGKSDDGKSHTLEFAHIKSLDECAGDMDKYQSPENLLHLCNSCHKTLDYAKGERVRRWTHGKTTFADPIVSIKVAGVEPTFDVEMDTPEHNFVANGVISHNSAHSTAYGLLAYQTAYLKCNYPTFYFAALLKSIEDHPKRDEKMSAYIADAREMGIAILPPDINESELNFTALPKTKSVRFGLKGIKFVGAASKEILNERKNGEFTDLFSAVERIKSRHTTSRVIESLVASGAMDTLPGSRASKLASLEAAMERADMLREDQKRIAAGGKPVKRKKPIPEPILQEADEDKVKLLAGERELIGYYLSGHPYLDFASSVTASHSVQEAREVTDPKEPITVGGIVSRLTLHTTKKGKKQMAFGAIEDDKAVIEFVIFPRQFEKLESLVKLDAPLVLSGTIEASTSDDDESAVSAKMIVNGATPVARGLKKTTKQQIEYQEVVTLPSEGYRDLLQKMRDRLNSTSGISDLKFILADGSEIKCVA